MNLVHAKLRQNVEQCLTQIRYRQIWLRIFISAITAMSLSAIVIALLIVIWPSASDNVAHFGHAMADSWQWPWPILTPIIGLWVILLIILYPVCFFYFRHRVNKRYKELPLTKLTLQNFLLHLNRQHPALEESAQLLVVPTENLSVPQTLQLKRIAPSLALIVQSSKRAYLPMASLQRSIGINIIVFLFALVLLASAIMLTSNSTKRIVGPQDTLAVNEVEPHINYLDKLVVSVQAPAYTQQAEFEQDDLNLSVLQGSVIEWKIPIKPDTRPQSAFELTLSSLDPVSFVGNEVGYTARITANIGAVYSISQTTDQGNFTSDIATITVQADLAPRISFKAPTLTITEVASNAIPSLETIVKISDDYGIEDVKIVASIAKGSGEAVKFRDQEFVFDRFETEHNQAQVTAAIIDQSSKASQAITSALYTKNWDLQSLNMEPGDELYFSVHVTDNKSPNSQQTVSPIKIIRWLENEDASVSGEGILIDFMPEYFKSQGQIIIETQALIEQRHTLDGAEFNTQSRGLGIDQSALKQSYGQYLGDEFESGLMHDMEAGPTVPNHEDHSEPQTENVQVEENHQHQDLAERAQNNSDLSGYQQAIEQFGHNHGVDDIGFIKTSEGQINPKVLMKRAIGEMWQAELHLQLSAPELALPYEKEALNYLNRAKQAERIYVKRLGFTPPPVSEERRYSGKLNDILSYQRNTSVAPQTDQNSQFIALIGLINQHLTLPSKPFIATPQLSSQTRLLIEDITRQLSHKLAIEPHWIEQLGTLKRIQIANSFSLKNCVDCLNSLSSELFKQVSPPIAQSYTRPSLFSTNIPIEKAYAEALLQGKGKPNNANTQVIKGNKP